MAARRGCGRDRQARRAPRLDWPLPAGLGPVPAEPLGGRPGCAQRGLEAIPEHLRHYALGDMDSKDWPLRVLVAGVGGHVETYYEPGRELVTGEMRLQALDYFADRERERVKWEQRTYADGPERAASPTVHLKQVVYPKGWPDDPGVLALRNEYPAAIMVDEVSYPTVVHAYWRSPSPTQPWPSRSVQRAGPTMRRSSQSKLLSARIGPRSGSRAGPT